MPIVESPREVRRRNPDPSAAGRTTAGLLSLAAVLLSIAPGAESRGSEATGEIASVEALWRDFDPEALPLEVETLREWDDGDGSYQTLRFTGESANDAKVRVFAIRGGPREGKGLPGILHVHGGGQTASLDWVRFWARRGYVCVSFDFCGPWEGRTDVTDWGPIRHGNMAQAAGGFQLRPTPRESSWYHWASVSRRALTLLARDPRADPERLGVFGVSVGGSLTWMIAGSDPRVKAAVPIYGCGYNYDRRNARWGLLVPNDDLNLFQRVLSPEAHAPFVSCPILFLSATNDGHGLMDRAYDALGATRGPTYQAFSPRTDHHVEPREGRNLAAWMDWHLKGGTAWPKSPGLRLGLSDDGIPTATVAPDAAPDVDAIDVYYALGDKRPQVRFWRRVEGMRRGEHWHASLPVLDPWDDLYAFANVTYRGGVCLSTELRHAIPAQIGKARATLAWTPVLEHGTDGLEPWVFLAAYTDPSRDRTLLKNGRDPEVGPYVGFDTEHLGDPVAAQLATHILGDPQFRGRDGWSLAFRARGAFTEDGLTLTVIEQDRSLQARSYSAKVTQAELAPGWREVVLPLSRFVDPEGRSPRRWADLDKLELRGKAARRDPPRFAGWRWVDRLAAKHPSGGFDGRDPSR